MNQLLPIVRRVRRPLVVKDTANAERGVRSAELVNEVSGGTPATTRETRVLHETSETSDAHTAEHQESR